MICRGVIFDLDGTLLDTLDDLADSMNAVLEREGIEPYPAHAYRYFVGDGMEMLARRVLGIETGQDERVHRCMAAMSEEYKRRWKQKTRPYPGIGELLQGLERAGVPKAVFSNKPEAFTRLAVTELLSGWKFDCVRGARYGFPCKPDPRGALAIAAALELEPATIAYVGDTDTDMRTARAAGMFAVGVAWGFRPASELREHGAARIIDRPMQLLEHFVVNRRSSGTSESETP